jgi:TonB family protein
MKKLILTAAFVFCCFGRLSASPDTALQQSFIAAKQLVDLSSDSAGPYQLDVDFVAQFSVPTQGRLTLKWEAKDRWWRRVVIGSFLEIQIKNGEWLYTVRNLDFTPTRIGDLISLLNLSAGTEDWMATNEKRRVENGTQMTCIRVERQGFKNRGHDVCLDDASHEILVDEWQDSPDEHSRRQYSEYFDFGKHRFPHKLELLRDGSKVVTANVVGLGPAPFDESLLTPPPEAIARRECANRKPPVAIRDPSPAYPSAASNNRMTGDTTVAMTVQKDGSVSDIHLVGSAAHDMNDATLQVLKGWKFKPAMCGTEPVVSDITIIVSFRITN